MKRIFAVGVLLATVMGILSLFSGTASAAPFVCTPGAVLISGNTAQITNDSGDKGNWAVDNFTRTTDVKVVSCGTKGQPDVYQVIVRDAGTFTTLPDGPSPRQGLPLPVKPFTGSFVGGTTYTVTSSLPPIDLPSGPKIAPINGSPDTADWWKRFFKSVGPVITPNSVDQGWVLKGSEDEYFSWTYTTTCDSNKKFDEKWVDSNSDGDGADKSAGDITGKVANCVPVTTTTPPPTTTTAPPTTTQPPATTIINNGGSGGSGGSVSTGTVAQVSTVPVGAPQTGFGGATRDGDTVWLFAGGSALIAASVLAYFAFFRKRGTRVTS